MLLSFVLAIICAKYFPETAVESKFLGQYFIKTLKAFVPFLIFGTITYSIASFDALSKIKTIVPLTIILYIFSTLLAITFALIVGSTINYDGADIYTPSSSIVVNENLDISSSLSILSIDFRNFSQLLMNSNPFAIMILSLFLGITFRFLSKYTTKPVIFLSKINNLVIQGTNYIMLLAPIAIFSLFSNLLLEVKGETIYSLLKFVLSSIFIFIFYMFFFYGIVVRFFCGISIFHFFKSIKNTLIFAFFSSLTSTSTSKYFFFEFII